MKTGAIYLDKSAKKNTGNKEKENEQESKTDG